MAVRSVSGVGEPSQREQRAFEMLDGLPRRRREQRSPPGAQEIIYRLAPHLAAERVVGEPLGLLAQPIGVDLLDRRNDPGVQGRCRACSRLSYATSWVSECRKVYSWSGKRRDS